MMSTAPTLAQCEHWADHTYTRRPRIGQKVHMLQDGSTGVVIQTPNSIQARYATFGIRPGTMVTVKLSGAITITYSRPDLLVVCPVILVKHWERFRTW